MGFLDRFRRKSAAASAMVMYRTGQAAARTTNPAALAKEGYGKNPDVFSAITGITTAAKGIEWKLLKLTQRAVRKGVTMRQVQVQLRNAYALGGQKAYLRKQRQLVKQRVLVPVDDHALLDLLAQPNPLMDWSDLIEALLGSYCLTGNAFLNGAGPDDPSRPPLELWPLRVDMTKIIVGDRDMPVAAYQYGKGEGQRIDAAHVLHLKTWNPEDDYWGMSPIKAAATNVDWANAAERWNLALMQNGGQPAGAVMVETELTVPQRKELKQWVDEEYSGTANVGRPLLLEGGMDWKQLALTPQEAAWLEGQSHATRKIAHVLGYPSVLLGDSSDKTFSNYREARKALYEEAVLPRLDMLRNKLNTWLVPRFGDDLMLAYDVDDIEALHEERDKEWGRIDASSELTLNEKREAKGYPPHPDGDVILVPATMIPVGLGAGTSEGTAKAGVGPDNAKAIGLQTYDQKGAWWQVMERQRDQLAERVQVLVERAFASEREAAIAAIRDAGSTPAAAIAVERAVEQHRDVWEATLRQSYLTVGEVFARQVLDQIEGKAGGLAYGVTKADAEDAWQQYVLGWLTTEAPNKSKQISDTSMTAIRAALGQGIEEGEGIDQLAERVASVYDAGTSWRATMIARTETIAASNLGSRAGAKATGLPLVKEWVATRDKRTRDSHEHAEEQYSANPIPLDDPFTVSNNSLMFPGDSSLGASAGEVVNCRCTEVYQLASE